MRITSVELENFRRFTSLKIRDIPPEARLVVLAGPNGSGKSSLFDAFLLKYRMSSGYGWNGDSRYYDRPLQANIELSQRITIGIQDNAPLQRGSVYVRTAYRNDPEFLTDTLSRTGPVLADFPINRLIESDATVARNYQRLASQAMEDVFVNEAATTKMGDFRDRLIGECREPLKRLFPDLTFVGVGNPLEQGTFQFDKGSAKSFDYKNLSGGEKAAFDLILDFVVKRKSYKDAIYCIDEPEAHISTKLQGTLLQELLGLIPERSQLWIASHSIGMMRKARELYEANSGSVTFLDFGGHDFDKPTVITPSKPTRAFWEQVLHVALDDLAALVAPREVIVCEGNPGGAVPGKNAEHDARVYSTIFAEEFPDVIFLSAGNSKEVAGDYLGIAAALPKIASGMKVKRLIDGDDHAPADVTDFNTDGIKVLDRRHLEAYLYDDEVLTALCDSINKPNLAPILLAEKQAEISSSFGRGNSIDDLK
ncbi:AAA family ATPase, partial [Mesorhizobium sp. M7A.F.Ca.MR.362.00.0.0]|uniref:AAA family ATPase n=1 Tax=Mesorhizobium sp. M7A.F.Ca.MR.362.00.0.0 TaxID=2496779 RepID=UPI0034D31814